ncbi:tetratricopeptide repeat protein [Sphingomonas sp. G-3-2-10]|uniref:tetratricopeptide repeat protein n=1 Tax=Sphingomonas sp. G-3-2-10 TaxID=2728838 RepID=UPI001469E682|nr:tetratricopeptide repeat protein [Sphingomonas sp. G-3-2-10]NML08414.1 sel1 repeat family protein [Sphingomonas sp. G-3-2-10]
MFKVVSWPVSIGCLLLAACLGLAAALELPAHATGNQPTARPTVEETLQDGLAAFERQDYPTAFRILKKWAERGDPTAQDVLAYMYENGWGADVDHKMAVFWYRKAAAQGATPSESSLGRMYEAGFGVERNPSYAAWWYKKAADKNYPGARDRLNALLRAGVMIAQPPEPALTRQASAPAPRPAARMVASPPAGGRPIWPTGMEPGNLYFVNNPNRTIYSNSPPIMVSARSAPEALSRIDQAERAWHAERGRAGLAKPFQVIAGGECIGPAWGAIVGAASSAGKPVWGAGCGKTPAEAFELAYANCERTGTACKTVNTWIAYLGLSGSSSWNGTYCESGCYPDGEVRFASFAAYAATSFTDGPRLGGMADTLATFGAPCVVGQTCFYTSVSSACHFNTPMHLRTEKCSAAALTRNGYSGTIR